jgi:glucan biosynthesis protein C
MVATWHFACAGSGYFGLWIRCRCPFSAMLGEGRRLGALSRPVGREDVMSAHSENDFRLGYLDNLRSTMIIWVVAFHTAITYSHIGSWYYSDPNPVGKMSALVFLTLEVHSQAFFMGLLFLLAGYFTPGALDRKGFRRFMADRFRRLGVPSLLYIFVVQPLLLHYLLGTGQNGLAAYYRTFLNSSDWLTGGGPMWFAIALLIFSLLYGLFRQIAPPKRKASVLPAPGLIGLMNTGLVIATFAFLIRTEQPMGKSFLWFQPAFFAQYIVLFALGIVANRNNWFASLPTRFGYRLLIGAAVIGPIAWFTLLVLGGGLEQGVVAYVGGWRWQSAAYAVWESLFCLAICPGLLVFYREHCNGRGRFSKLMSDNSFGIYFVHAPVVVAVSQMLGWLPLPPLAKWLVVAPLAFLVTLAVVHLVLRQTPLLRRIL